MSNICIRCGEERVLSKSWKEVVQLYERTTVIFHEDFVCPDKECQKAVVEKLLLEQKKRQSSEHQRELEKRSRLKAIQRHKRKS